MLGDDQGPRFRQIEHLPGDMAGRHRRGQRFAAPGAGRWIMVDGGIGLFNSAKRLARMARLTAGLLTGRFAQAADPGGFFSRRWTGACRCCCCLIPRRRSNSAMRAKSICLSQTSRAFCANRCSMWTCQAARVGCSPLTVEVASGKGRGDAIEVTDTCKPRQRRNLLSIYFGRRPGWL